MPKIADTGPTDPLEQGPAGGVSGDAPGGVSGDAGGELSGEAAGGELSGEAPGGVSGEAGGELSGEAAAAISAQSRTLRNSLLGLAVFFALVAALLLAVPGLRSAAERITDARAGWVAVAVGFELLSCAGYVLLFALVFGMLGRRLISRLSLSELAVNSVVSVSGLAGIALGAWVLRSRGVSVERIAKRSVLIFVLTSAVNVLATLLIGVPMYLGLLPGSENALLTLLPAAAAAAAIAGTLALAHWARRTAEVRLRSRGRLFVALTALSGGVFDALALIRARDWRLLGAVAYWLFDVAVLYACLLAYGPSPSFWAVSMAYLVGMLANALPIPAGLVAVEGGLFGMLLLFGVRPGSAVLAAVVIYRAISLWIPALIGSLAFLSLRRELARPVAPGVAAS
ncbi:MAG TPA: lysylphosphatidylglycerol synthase transmembrane domain-containing protein [Solirubrobacteraceae bacterium]|nr:lysylphosphatidylglycerol synthase transmembrane domain-containing protein [Solirubrobacteraceae bacterium]